MIDLGKSVVKTGKAKKETGPQIVTLKAVDVFTPRAAQESLRGIFRCGKGKPSPKSLVFNTPEGPVHVWRESEKGFAATWFCKDRTGKTFEGTKNACREDAAARISLAYRAGRNG